MECGSEDVLCQAFSLLADNELAASVLAKLVGSLGATASGLVGAVAVVLKEHGEKLIALAGFIFGLYKWWVYREKILHKRLAEYINESDRRLLTEQDYVVEALNRPGPGQAFREPLFADSDLRSALRVRNWDNTSFAWTVEQSSAWQLEKAKRKISKRLEIADRSIASLRQQLAVAHIVSGAISASSASRDHGKLASRHAEALGFFRAALSIPGHGSNVSAKEYEAHQLRKMGYLPDALEAYQELEACAPSVVNLRARDILIARAKRYQAELIQARAASKSGDGQWIFKGVTSAYDLLASETKAGAFEIRARHAPYRGWDLLEQADMHYLTAFISRNLDFSLKEAANLNNAETCYQSIKSEIPRSLLRRSRGFTRVLRLAEEGLSRVRDARSGHYDIAWLMPPLE